MTNHESNTWEKVIKPQFLINNEKFIQRIVIANEFNKYFVSLASKLNEEVSFRFNNYFNDFKLYYTTLIQSNLRTRKFNFSNSNRCFGPLRRYNIFSGGTIYLKDQQRETENQYQIP